jgi:hypothetical protein
MGPPRQLESAQGVYLTREPVREAARSKPLRPACFLRGPVGRFPFVETEEEIAPGDRRAGEEASLATRGLIRVPTATRGRARR